jgi:hypothetical protein
MQNDTDKVIQDQFNSLPPDIREAISRIPWKERVREIAKRENLDAAKTDSLETETMFVLYGFLSPDTFTDNITSEVGVSVDQAERLSKIINDEVIGEIEKQFEMIEALEPKNDAPNIPSPTQESAPTQTSPESHTESPAVPEIAPEILPKTIDGQAAHDAPKSVVEEKLTQITSAKSEPSTSGYAGGADPYREPIE